METILVVDDEALVRSMARDILLGAGYRVLEAADGEQALRVAEEHPGAIQVLLTDVVLPGINGKELAARMVALRPETKMLFMSGRAAEVVSETPTSSRWPSPASSFSGRPARPPKCAGTWSLPSKPCGTVRKSSGACRPSVARIPCTSRSLSI
jgi:CheY-like chemotaxis protein